MLVSVAGAQQNKLKGEIDLREHLGQVAVDSGRLMIIDPCYVKYLDNYTPSELATVDDGEVPFPLGHSGMALVFPSGLGDGMYDVYAHYVDLGGWGKRIGKVEIVLI